MTMTPLMRQYWDIKSLHQDKVLLFRMGDFFEIFFDDARKAAPILGITLTSRNKKSNDETPMCGFPHHSVAGPINRLLGAGLKVAICEQIEDPKFAKGIVKRAVTRVLTPGMVFDSDTLEQTQSHYMAALGNTAGANTDKNTDKNTGDLAFVDTTTGEAFYFQELTTQDQLRLLLTLPVAELIVAEDFSGLVGLQTEKILISKHSFAENIPATDGPAKTIPDSVARLCSYVQSLGGQDALRTVQPFVLRSLNQRLELSATVLRHLEIFATYKGEGLGSLFSAINRTQTSSGARLLRQWLAFPLSQEQEICARHDLLQNWISDSGRLQSLRKILSGMGDIERRLGKIAQPQCNPRDLIALAQSVNVGIEALSLAQIANRFLPLQTLAHDLESTLVEEPPLTTKAGHLIRKGFSSELDSLIELSTDSQSMLAKMEAAERELTGISSLKIRYNNVFGFYIEITNTHKEKVPAHYLRKQTLSNAERYCTDELIELEKKVLSAQTKRSDLEFEIFNNLREKVLLQARDLLTLASVCSELDVVTGLAWLAMEKKYVRPQFSSSGISLRASRHPVVEQTVTASFIANDILISSMGCLLLTGPNMAGKSTLMRQVALTVILGQMGSFVPADEAQLPVFDQIFTRIGASDQLSEGLSTFMVEMTETSDMLAKSGRKSLVVLDEIGRGTSTFDGMSLAQSILEYILCEVKATTLFATHYHELTKLEAVFPQLRNAHMTVSERSGEIRFLHTLAWGPAQKSYGIQVAKLAGLPTKVTQRAQALLKNLEAGQKAPSAQLSLLEDCPPQTSPQASPPASLQTSGDACVNPDLEKMIGELRGFAVSKKTPLEAMVKIAEWQEALSSLQNH